MQKYLKPDHSIKVGRNSGPYVQREQWLNIRYQGPFVILLVGDKPIALSTPQAHRVAWEMLRTADECIRAAHNGVLWDGHTAQESVVLTINGQSMNVSPAKARKVAAGLMRKADSADDFQRNNHVRMVRK